MSNSAEWAEVRTGKKKQRIGKYGRAGVRYDGKRKENLIIIKLASFPK